MKRGSLFASVILAIALFSSAVQAQTNRVTVFPTNFDQMVMYGDYRRGTGGELAYALQETIDTAQAGLPLPPGTRLVLEIYNDGNLTDYKRRYTLLVAAPTDTVLSRCRTNSSGHRTGEALSHRCRT